MSTEQDTLAHIAQARAAHNALATLRQWAEQNGIPDLYGVHDLADALANDAERLLRDLDKARNDLVVMKSVADDARTDVRIMCSRLEDRDEQIGELRKEREEIRALLGAGPCESAVTAARRVSGLIPSEPSDDLVAYVALAMVRRVFGDNATLSPNEAGPWRMYATAAINALAKFKEDSDGR
jgi:hypothetical protein